MRKLDISPEAFNDLEAIKEYLDSEFGEKEEKNRLRAIINDLKRLQKYPETDIKLFERLGIITDYKCIYTNQNYAFYRVEDEFIKVVRILDVRRDFMYILLGVHMTSDESEDYWDE